MDLATEAKAIDDVFGFPSNWTFVRGVGCFEHEGLINIDPDHIKTIVADAGLGPEQEALVTRHVMGHEKGHHLQELTTPNRPYETNRHVMEIEADLIGGWTVAKRLGHTPKVDAGVAKAVKQFDDVAGVSKQIGQALGSQAPKNPGHPWAEQRDLALLEGAKTAAIYHSIKLEKTRTEFAHYVRQKAGAMKHGR